MTNEQKLRLLEKKFKKSEAKCDTLKQVFKKKCSPNCKKCKECRLKHKKSK